MEKQYLIYKLIHPITNNVFYVGKTSKGLDIRFKFHLKVKNESPVSIYISSLLKDEITPIIELIKISDDVNDERNFILHYGKLYNLYNVILPVELSEVPENYDKVISLFKKYKTKYDVQTIINKLNITKTELLLYIRFERKSKIVYDEILKHLINKPKDIKEFLENNCTK